MVGNDKGAEDAFEFARRRFLVRRDDGRFLLCGGWLVRWTWVRLLVPFLDVLPRGLTVRTVRLVAPRLAAIHVGLGIRLFNHILVLRTLVLVLVLVLLLLPMLEVLVRIRIVQIRLRGHGIDVGWVRCGVAWGVVEGKVGRRRIADGVQEEFDRCVDVFGLSPRRSVPYPHAGKDMHCTDPFLLDLGMVVALVSVQVDILVEAGVVRVEVGIVPGEVVMRVRVAERVAVVHARREHAPRWSRAEDGRAGVA